MKYSNWWGLAALVAPLAGRAQVINPALGAEKNLVYASAGFDQALLNLTLGYGRRLHLPRLGGGRPLLLSADLSVPPTSYGLGNRRLRLGAQLNLLETGAFALPLKLKSALSHARNAAYDATGFSSALTLLPHFTLGRWALGVEGYYQYGWATHLRQRPAYLANYPDARDGWYGGAASTRRLGAAVGYRFGPQELTLRAGYQQNGKFDTYLPPYYALLGFVRRFGETKTR